LGSEPSAAVSQLLGPIGPTDTLVSWIERADEHAGMSLAMGWPELAEPFLPIEVLLDQLPKRATVDQRTVALEYRPIMQADKLERVLLVATDITSEVARERAEVEQLELLSLFRLATNDPNGLREMVAELGRQVEDACNSAADLAAVKRSIHTVKGNAGILGVHRLAELCHKIEEAMAERGDGVSTVEAAELQQLFSSVSARVDALSGTRSDDLITIEKSELATVLEALMHGGDRRKLASQMATWHLEPADRRLERLAELTKGLAKRLGKDVQVLIDPSGLRLPVEYAEVWAALPHVVRNAVDHGVESADERVASAKESSATVLLQARKEQNRVVIQVCDDGRGIDWEAVREKATRLGMAAENDQQLTDALFSDGFSTKEVASDISGRGVGMSALKAAVDALQGEVKVDTMKTQGTTVRISLPLIGALRDLPQSQPPRAA
jgi:two-component system chemotaxis sensor kinase CheA